MRVLICGARDWDNYKKIFSTLKRIHKQTPVHVVIEGGQVKIKECMDEPGTGNARLDYHQEKIGADHQGKMAARKLGIPVMEFEANWDFYKLSAGPIRNGWMLKFGQPDLVLAFHSDIKNSKGTKNMVEQAKKKGIPVKVIK